MEPREYLRALRRHWIGALLILVLATGGAAYYSHSQPKVYAADATGFVVAGGPTDNPAEASVSDSLAKSRAVSYVAVATSRAVAQRVITALDLDTSPSALIGSVSVSQPEGTVQIKITTRASTALAAQRLADAWVVALAAEVKSIEDPTGVATQAASVRPVETAALPGAPISPQPRRDTAIGLLLGLLLGVVYAIARHQLDRRLRTASQIEEDYGHTVLGEIPIAKELDAHHGEAGVALQTAFAGEPSSAGEAFRKLRTNLAYSDVDSPPRVIVITSPRESDGKSTIVVNLAATIASAGRPVTLVDADLRRSTVARRLHVDDVVGLTDVLIGSVEVHEALRESPDVPGLRILPAGSVPPNPSELLGSQAMSSLLRTLADDGIVLVDAAPLLPVTDAAVLAPLCDGVLLAVSYAKTSENEMRAALGNIERVSGRVLGVVLNRIERSAPELYYYRKGYYTAGDKGPLARLRPRRLRRRGQRPAQKAAASS
ncbi:polysaccharide biosynthesis tyrosine autokinase [Nocardioides sp. TRM66260-LWL]|uniref:polysaccharide biosynthesis tyrosine autokinase n=1 Tax=Nocardioides sp. TRM66260-LWL TaxID=2874478 RepID=UPI001CC4267E|nr:polysaccharide biosynthesis tyrosine autokinase [Nocardioides sp. TRM66260-LWL]MBZ5734967.1 polysaccharide biosynthesis tyrosine autokinase [Nocardioides sp. TRM66260-LWL]